MSAVGCLQCVDQVIDESFKAKVPPKFVVLIFAGRNYHLLFYM